MKTTPGPWAKHTPNSPETVALIVRELPNHRRTVIAVIPNHLQHGNASVTDWEEAEGNARLVAAAPELLRLLKEARKLLTGPITQEIDQVIRSL
jgi:hypothetical protein